MGWVTPAFLLDIIVSGWCVYNCGMSDITTKQAIKDKLSIADNAWDDVLDGLIDGAIAQIRNIVTHGLDASGTQVEYFDEQPIYLNHTPVTAVTKVEYWNGSVWVTESDTTAYRLLSTGQLKYNFIEGLDALKVTYTGGEQSEVLRELIERMVIRQYRKMEHEGEDSTSFDASTTSWHEVLQDSDWDILDNFRVCI